jgi:ribosome recycling factor
MYDTNELKKEMAAVIDRFNDAMKKVRTGRAHPDMLGSVKVEAYGQFMPLNQVANVTVSGASMLLVTPFDPSNIQNISSAIRADQTLGLNPADDGKVVRVPIPPLTEERRKEIVKTASGKVEEAKIAMRKLRDEARKDLKNEEISDDMKKRAEKEIDDITKDFSSQVDKLFADKQAEIMKI